jgi:hypothetical protein
VPNFVLSRACLAALIQTGLSANWASVERGVMCCRQLQTDGRAQRVGRRYPMTIECMSNGNF